MTRNNIGAIAQFRDYTPQPLEKKGLRNYIYITTCWLGRIE